MIDTRKLASVAQLAKSMALDAKRSHGNFIASCEDVAKLELLADAILEFENEMKRRMADAARDICDEQRFGYKLDQEGILDTLEFHLLPKHSEQS